MLECREGAHFFQRTVDCLHTEIVFTDCLRFLSKKIRGYLLISSKTSAKLRLIYLPRSGILFTAYFHWSTRLRASKTHPNPPSPSTPSGSNLSRNLKILFVCNPAENTSCLLGLEVAEQRIVRDSGIKLQKKNINFHLSEHLTLKIKKNDWTDIFDRELSSRQTIYVAYCYRPFW